MRYSIVVFFLFVVLLCTIVQCQAPDNYKAAVVEYSPIYQTGIVNRTTALSIMNNNLNHYAEYIQEAANQGSDIILFPEDGLYGSSFYTRNEIYPYLEYIPDVNPQNQSELKYTPCNFQGEELARSPILSRASCLAKNSKITLVLNMGEIRHCSTDSDSNCPSDSRYQYNTLVAFSSSGELVAKYHKSHLYYEPQFDEPEFPDVVWFESDFGVRFGMMICFDLMFEDPQLTLYYHHGIRNFLWSSWWVNEPPLITGTQVELSRSLALSSNFLAAGIGLSWYNSGSGIYSYGRPFKHWYNFGSNPLSRMLIAELPKENQQEQEQEREQDISYERVAARDRTPVGPATPPNIRTFSVTPGISTTVVSTSNGLECTAVVQVSESSLGGNELFGVYSLNGIYNGLFPAQICALLRCYDEECVTPILETSTTFDSYSISGNFLLDQLFMLYPMTATNHSLAGDPHSYTTNTMKFPTALHSNNQNAPHNILNAALFGLEFHTLY